MKKRGRVSQASKTIQAARRRLVAASQGDVRAHLDIPGFIRLETQYQMTSRVSIKEDNADLNFDWCGIL